MVPTSVTPQGVEHYPWNGNVRDGSRVPTSVTPQGVEHQTLGDKGDIILGVPTSVTPQGVEHSYMDGGAVQVQPGAHLRDAARR